MNNLYPILIGIIILALGATAYFMSQTNNENRIQTTTEETITGDTTTSAQDSTAMNSENMMTTVVFKTSMGDITLELDPTYAPNTVANFVTLASEGFYDGTKFHRVIAGFMIQGGDPLSKDDSLVQSWGTGGPGYSFDDEITPNNHNNTGTIAMANAGPNTNGSQFFINVADNNFLDTKHTVFGKVVGGMDVVTAIENTQTGASDRPVTPVVITAVEIKN